MRSHLSDRVALVLALLAMPACAVALDLDRFTDALPPNPCLPLSGQPVVFAGEFCDGAACPPAPWVTCESMEVVQTGQAGVFAGTQRHVRLFPFYGDVNNRMSVRIDPGTQRLLATLDATTEVGVALSYGTPLASFPDPGALNLDLVALGVESVRLELAGSFTPAQPLFVFVVFLSDGFTSPRPSALAAVTVSQAGVVTIPLAAFQPRLGFSMTDVDDIELWFSQCDDYEIGCPTGAYDPMQLSLGPIVFHQGTTSATRTSWGSLKSVYR